MSTPYPAAAFTPESIKAAPPNIPLKCNICPKKPNFSDVSHLLTHIASKAHLSTYYKIKVRSAQESASRALIDEYDVWYTTNGIEDLMSERLNLKEQKRKQRVRQNADVNKATRRSHSMTDVGSLPSAPFLSVEQRPLLPYDFSTVDPSLSVRNVKQEENRPDNVAFSIEHDPQYETPPWLPWVPAYYPEGTYQPGDGLPTPESFPESPLSHDIVFLDSIERYASHSYQDNTKVSDSNMLKGIIWPGMDLFDSATPEMRRKRNQKKSLDVVDRLVATSNLIEATEVVYTPEINESKSRPITGFPHSSVSPVKRTSSPAPAKKARKSSAGRKPLMSKDLVNAIPKRRARTVSARMVTINETGKLKRGRKPKQAITPATSIIAACVAKDAPVDATPDSLDVLDAPFSAITGAQHTLTSAFRPANSIAEAHNGYHSHDTFRHDFDPTSDFGGYDIGNAHGTTLDNPFHSPRQHQSGTGPSDPAILPAWDFLNQDLANILSNPFLLSSGVAAGQDDDERTISAPMSEV
ncbi:Hypothetical protein D9617_10g073810 [Elsinoe fawcettii]|nr:Hypothetical protein D9617_10g073810 [Elsinoe fawcettii]